MRIAHNLTAMNSQRQLNINTKSRAKSVEKLSSGFRINRSADDAAGLAISEKMRRQIRGLTQASKNVQDGISFCQVADGALHEVDDMLHRITELAVKSANGTNTDEDREYLDKEVQQIKDELTRIFKTTDFNGIKIFKADYLPEVSGTPNDYQFFNLGNASTSGGIITNNIRYTWAELGIDKANDLYEANGTYYFNEDKTYTKTLANGETLELQGKKDAEISTLSRVYRWEAAADGITINDNTSEKITWSKVRNDDTHQAFNTTAPEPGMYSFNYHGTNIAFEVPPEDKTFDDVLAGINGTDSLNRTYWFTEAAGVSTSPAVSVTDTARAETKYQHLTTGNASAWTSPNLRISAGTGGITLKSDDTTASYTFISWADMKAADGSTPAYPIIDWGTTDSIEDVTLDDSVTYKYKDSLTGISFAFKLKDESSLGEVIKGLNDVMINPVFSANMNSESTVSNSDASMKIGYANLSFGLQNILRDDGSSDYMAKSYTWDTDLSLNAAGDNFTLELDYKGADDAHTAKYSATLTRSSIESLIRRTGGEDTTKLYLSNKSALLSLATSVERSQGLKTTNPIDDYVNVTYSAAGLHDQYKAKIDALDARMADPDDLITQAEYDAAVKTAMDDAVNAFVDFVNNNKDGLNFTSNYSQVEQTTIGPAKSSSSNSTIFGMKTSAPLKALDIQAGSEGTEDNRIRMEWSPLSLGILGIRGASVATQSSATATISSVKEALKIVNTERTTFGAYQNRFEHTVNSLENVIENTTAAESTIRDTDMASEAVRMSMLDILIQAGQSMLAQANQIRENVVSLLR